MTIGTIIALAIMIGFLGWFLWATHPDDAEGRAARRAEKETEKAARAAKNAARVAAKTASAEHHPPEEKHEESKKEDSHEKKHGGEHHEDHGHAKKSPIPFFVLVTAAALALAVVFMGWDDISQLRFVNRTHQAVAEAHATATPLCEGWMHENIPLTQNPEIPSKGKCNIAWDTEPGSGPVTFIDTNGNAHTYTTGTDFDYDLKYWESAGDIAYVRAAFCEKPSRWDDSLKRCV